MANELVLVTGGAGFIGAHCAVRLLNAGYQVRATVRSLKREPHVRAMVKAGGAEAGDALSFVEADLTSDTGWKEAVAGCTYVLHVASPIPHGVPKHEDDVIRPAVEGTLRVLRAARDAGVKRVVLTSAFGAVGYSQKADVFTEENWTDPEAPIAVYPKSKTLAERAAWDFIATEGRGMELAVINPGAVFGPVLGENPAGSIVVVQMLLKGAVPRIPRLSFPVVDVRDVADLHVRAMTNPSASGQRFLATSGETATMADIAALLRSRLGDQARLVPTKPLPDWMVRLGARFVPMMAEMAKEMGTNKRTSNEKARRLLGWSPRSNEEALLATAESLLRPGLATPGTSRG